MAFLKRFPWLTFTGNAGKVLAVNAGETDFELVTPSGSGSLPELLISKHAPTTDQTITDGYFAYYSGYYEIGDLLTLEIGDGSTLEIG